MKIQLLLLNLKISLKSLELHKNRILPQRKFHYTLTKYQYLLIVQIKTINNFQIRKIMVRPLVKGTKTFLHPK